MQGLEELIEAAPTAMIHLNSDASAIQINSQWSISTGQSSESGLNSGWMKMLDEESQEDFLTDLRNSLRDGSSIRGRLKLKNTSGQTRWVEVSTIPLRNPSNNPEGSVMLLSDISEEMEEAKRAKELTRVLEASPDLVAILDPLGRAITWANDAITSHLNSKSNEQLLNSLDSWSQAQYATVALPTVRSTGIWRGELRLSTSQNKILPISTLLVAHRNEENQIEAISMVARDLSELKAAEQRVEASEIRLAALVEHASDLVCVADDVGRVIYASPAVARVLNLSASELEGTPVFDLVHPDDREDLMGKMEEIVNTPGISPSLEARVAHADGGWRHMEVVTTNLLNNPAVSGIVINARDITERVEVAAQLEEKAFHDELTGLPNRSLLLERLADALHRASRHDRMVGVLFLDLDRFKVVNDSLGHSVGDELLSETARRLEQTIRPDDTVARLGGDEFVVVIGNMIRTTDALVAAERVRSAVAQPVTLGNESTVVTTSVGIAIAFGDESPAELLQDADTAMYRAKEGGRDRAEMFDDHLRAQAVRRHSVEQTLRSALENKRIEVHFQPVVRISDGSVVGAEALARIRTPEGELLQPVEFIDVAEDSGLIADLGSQVLTLAFQRVARWSKNANRPFSMAVNVSARQLADPAFPALVGEALKANNLDPEQVALEFTESALIAANPVTEQVLGQLTELGIRMGLDDCLLYTSPSPRDRG